MIHHIMNHSNFQRFFLSDVVKKILILQNSFLPTTFVPRMKTYDAGRGLGTLAKDVNTNELFYNGSTDCGEPREIEMSKYITNRTVASY